MSITSIPKGNKFWKMTQFNINTLNRGRFIWVLLGGLFLVGFVLAQFPLSELTKILTLLFCIPVLMWLAVRLNRSSSVWEINSRNIRITKENKTTEIPVADIAYVKNHMRSGGNLIVLHRHSKSGPFRFWRNKLFMADDDFDKLIPKFRELQIEIVLG